MKLETCKVLPLIARKCNPSVMKSWDHCLLQQYSNGSDGHWNATSVPWSANSINPWLEMQLLIPSSSRWRIPAMAMFNTEWRPVQHKMMYVVIHLNEGWCWKNVAMTGILQMQTITEWKWLILSLPVAGNTWYLRKCSHWVVSPKKTQNVEYKLIHVCQTRPTAIVAKKHITSHNPLNNNPHVVLDWLKALPAWTVNCTCISMLA